MAIETASLSKDVEDMNSYATWRNVLGHTFVFFGNFGSVSILDISERGTKKELRPCFDQLKLILGAPSAGCFFFVFFYQLPSFKFFAEEIIRAEVRVGFFCRGGFGEVGEKARMSTPSSSSSLWRMLIFPAYPMCKTLLPI